jgi:hypothetical protein
MLYYSNGSFNWHDVYFMPIRLREFYWNKLIETKEKEKEANDKIISKSKTTSSSSRVRRR